MVLTPLTILWKKGISMKEMSSVPDPGLPDFSSPDAMQVIRRFEARFPAAPAMNEEGKAYLSALVKTFSAMDERLYHLYRPMEDLLCRFICEASPPAGQEDPLWQDALRLAARAGFPGLVCQPHKNESGEDHSI